MKVACKKQTESDVFQCVDQAIAKTAFELLAITVCFIILLFLAQNVLQTKTFLDLFIDIRDKL